MKTQVFWGVTLVLGFAVSANAVVIYVDDDAPSAGSGTSWSDPHRRLQDALEAVGPETTEIRIAGGTYKPDQSDFGVVQPLDRTAQFVLPGDVIIRGGYAGLQNLSGPDQHDPDQFPTILTGDLLGNDVAINDATKMDNSHRIVHATVSSDFIHLEDVTIRQAFGEADGAALYVLNSSYVTLHNVSMLNNETSEINTFRIGANIGVEMERCLVLNNRAFAQAGGLVIFSTSLAIVDCDFRHNTAEVLAGLFFGTPTSTTAVAVVANSTFIDNRAALAGGGIIFGLETPATFANCIIARNAASFGGGILGTGAVLSNCVLVGNEGQAIDSASSMSLPWEIRNCVAWNNSPVHFSDLAIGTGVSMTYSCIEGGWEGGIANIDADPMFVQPGTNNFRLSHNSPCLNMGLNGALPADTLDLDGDGNTTEPLPIDLAGAARIQDGLVDMGAYEGSFDPLPPADQTESLDQGEFVILVPSGEPFVPGEVSAMFVQNISGGDDAIVTVTDLSGQTSGFAGGLPEDVALLSLETSLANGTFLATLIQPFDTLSLGATEGTSARATTYDELTHEWLLAPALNHANSPGYNEPIGDLIVNSTISGWTPTSQPGDYGVAWEQALLKGFAWAHIDRPGEYGLRFGDCPSDCAPPGGNGAVDIRDMLFVLQSYGIADHRWCDIDGVDGVDVNDMSLIFAAWGGCP